MPAFTPVGSGSLLHVLAECNASLDAGHTMALFDGRELDSRTPAVYSALLPCPFSLCEVAAAPRDLWPDRPAAASFLVNGQPVDSLEDFTTSCPLVQPMPRVPLPPDIRPPPFRPVPTHAVLSRLPGFTEADIGSVSAFTPTTTSSTTTGPCALPVSVRIAFALPGQRPKSVPLLAGGHLADSLWDLLSAPACSYDSLLHWRVAACPRFFPEVSANRLVLFTLATPDPLVHHVWVDIRTDRPILRVVEVGEGRSREELLDRFFPGRPGLLLYLDGALAGERPALRHGCVLTICREPWECATSPLSSLFAVHPTLRILQFPFSLPRATLDLARTRQELAATAIPVPYSRFRASFFARFMAEFDARIARIQILQHRSPLMLCSPFPENPKAFN